MLDKVTMKKRYKKIKGKNGVVEEIHSMACIMNQDELETYGSDIDYFLLDFFNNEDSFHKVLEILNVLGYPIHRYDDMRYDKKCDYHMLINTRVGRISLYPDFNAYIDENKFMENVILVKCRTFINYNLIKN